MEAPIVSLHRRIHDSLHDLLASGPSNHEKHLDKFFKVLLRDFGDSFGDSLISQTSPENHVFCTNRVKSKKIFKNFYVFPHITCILIVLSASPSPKTFIFTHKTSIFFINPSSIFKNRYGFSLIFNLFRVSYPSFIGFCVTLRYENMVVEYGFVDVLMSLIYGFCWFC